MASQSDPAGSKRKSPQDCLDTKLSKIRLSNYCSSILNDEKIETLGAWRPEDTEWVVQDVEKTFEWLDANEFEEKDVQHQCSISEEKR